jgi:hypothetical protein
MDVLGLGIYNGWPWSLYGFPYGPAEIDPAVKQRLDTIPSATLPTTRMGKMFFGPNVSDSNPQANRACRDKAALVYDSVVMGKPWLTPEAAALDKLTPLEWLLSIGCNITRDDVVAQGLNQVNVSDPQVTTHLLPSSTTTTNHNHSPHNHPPQHTITQSMYRIRRTCRLLSTYL